MSQIELTPETQSVLDRIRHEPKFLSLFDMPADLAEAAVQEVFTRLEDVCHGQQGGGAAVHVMVWEMACLVVGEMMGEAADLAVGEMAGVMACLMIGEMAGSAVGLMAAAMVDRMMRAIVPGIACRAVRATAAGMAVAMVDLMAEETAPPTTPTLELSAPRRITNCRQPGSYVPFVRFVRPRFSASATEPSEPVRMLYMTAEAKVLSGYKRTFAIAPGSGETLTTFWTGYWTLATPS